MMALGGLWRQEMVCPPPGLLRERGLHAPYVEVRFAEGMGMSDEYLVSVVPRATYIGFSNDTCILSPNKQKLQFQSQNFRGYFNA